MVEHDLVSRPTTRVMRFTLYLIAVISRYPGVWLETEYGAADIPGFPLSVLPLRRRLLVALLLRGLSPTRASGIAHIAAADRPHCTIRVFVRCRS